MEQYVTIKDINMSAQESQAVLVFVLVILKCKLCQPLQGPSSQRHCGVCKRRAAAYLPGCMRLDSIFGRLTPCWSAEAGFSEASVAARSGASEMH